MVLFVAQRRVRYPVETIPKTVRYISLSVLSDPFNDCHQPLRICRVKGVAKLLASVRRTELERIGEIWKRMEKLGARRRQSQQVYAAAAVAEMIEA
jgi:hypothetical protein